MAQSAGAGASCMDEVCPQHRGCLLHSTCLWRGLVQGGGGEDIIKA